MASLLQLGLVAPEDVWLSQAGDHMHDEVLSTMDPGLLRLLQDHHYHNMTAVSQRATSSGVGGAGWRSAPAERFSGQPGRGVGHQSQAAQQASSRVAAAWRPTEGEAVRCDVRCGVGAQNLPDQEAHRPLIVVCHTFPDCWRTPADDDPRCGADTGALAGRWAVRSHRGATSSRRVLC